jgi:enediyne biosynthesis protein E4
MVLGIMPRMLYRNSNRWTSLFSRRWFLKHSSLLAGAFPLGKLPIGGAWPLAAASRPDAFEEIPASRSGIGWVHTAGKSAEKHLPETSGAGCAFFDYDNDGWMDIYLVNSGG